MTDEGPSHRRFLTSTAFINSRRRTGNISTPRALLDELETTNYNEDWPGAIHRKPRPLRYFLSFRYVVCFGSLTLLGIFMYGNSPVVSETTEFEVTLPAKNRTSPTMPHPPFRLSDRTFHEAFDADGQGGYIADPKSLERIHRQFLDGRLDGAVSNPFFDAYENYEAQYRADSNKNVSISESDNCAVSGGQGKEGIAGFALLYKKIRVANPTVEPRILCLIYTHPARRDAARAAALSWGVLCDGFLAFSTETIPSLGIVELIHPGEESYGNMWQKVRSIWGYVGQHYLNDYDYFHLGGDDMYVIVDNLRWFLRSLESQRKPDDPLFVGQWVKQKRGPAVTGGPGYTLSRAALARYVSSSLHSCWNHVKASYEDRLMSLCMHNLGIYPADSRDPATGEQLYHDVDPNQLPGSRPGTGKSASFHSRGLAYWQTLPHPHFPNRTVGPLLGMHSAGRYSVSFHHVGSDVEHLARIHAILYRLCPKDSELGLTLR